MTITCPHCEKTVGFGDGQPVRFCPYCGKALDPQADAGSSALEKRLMAEKKPIRKYQIIQEALAANPDDYDANLALLYHGRLHEPMKGRQLDFSIIKGHLLCVFHEPDKLAPEVLDEKYEELLRGPQLRRVLALAPDPDAQFEAYLRRLAFDYVDLFIRGDSRYANVVFGFSRSPDALARRCAAPVQRMLEEISKTDRLEPDERILLRTAVRDAYTRVFGSGKYLDA